MPRRKQAGDSDGCSVWRRDCLARSGVLLALPWEGPCHGLQNMENFLSLLESSNPFLDCNFWVDFHVQRVQGWLQVLHEERRRGQLLLVQQRSAWLHMAIVLCEEAVLTVEVLLS